MKKYLYIIILACFLSYSQECYSQIRINIDSLYISYIIDSVDVKKNTTILYHEDLEHGPYIYLNVTFENLGKDTLFLDTILDFTHSDKVIHKKMLRGDDNWGIRHAPGGGVYMIYSFNDRMYEIIPDTIYPTNRGPLLPHQKQTISFGAWMFLGTDIKKQNGYDYSKEVIESLPTLQVIFENNNKMYKSMGMKNVICIDTEY